jgi:hypothetical protein
VADVIVGIHQPNFLPWLGFFDKLASSDIFILLDSVRFSRGSRTNRVQVMAVTEPTWLTVPVRRPDHGEPLIAEASIDDSRPWRSKARRTLQVSYGSCRGATETLALVEPLLLRPTDRLADLNEAGIREIAAALSLGSGRLVRSSELDVAGTGSELLARLVEAVGGTVYLSGAGAGGYLEQEPFSARGIELRIQSFVHPDYEQRSPEPVRGLSIVDAMMNLGLADTQRLFDPV